MEFGEKLRTLREKNGMTQQTLADQLYVTRQAVSRWEVCAQCLRVAALFRFLFYTGVCAV